MAEIQLFTVHYKSYLSFISPPSLRLFAVTRVAYLGMLMETELLKPGVGFRLQMLILHLITYLYQRHSSVRKIPIIKMQYKRISVMDRRQPRKTIHHDTDNHKLGK
jgi:hypothetical protein